MRDLTLLIEDDRYTVPTLRLEVLGNSRTLADVADDVLRESEHHRAVEVHEGVRLLIRRSRSNLRLS